MGLFEALVKIVQGKPVFEPSQSTPQSTSAQPSQPAAVGYDASGKKQLPKVYVSHTSPRLSGNNIEVWVTVKNASEYAVRLKTINLLNTSRQLANYLSPGEAEELLIYSGPRPTSDHYNRAELYFEMTDTNDYFCAEHMIKYDYDTDGTYIVEELEPYDYVKDV